MPTTHTPETRAQVLAAVRETNGANLTAIAAAFGIARSTVRAWCRAEGVPVVAPTERERLGGQAGTMIQWGNWRKRRAKARKMRAKGATLAAIAKACGYRGESGALQAVSDT